MFTKHFHNFLIQFWTQCGIGVKDFISLTGYSNTMEGKKMMDLNRREMYRPRHRLLPHSPVTQSLGQNVAL